MESDILLSLPFFYFYSICFLILPKYLATLSNDCATDLVFFILFTVIDIVKSSGYREDILSNLEADEDRIWKVVSEKYGFFAKVLQEMVDSLISSPVSSNAIGHC